METGAEAKMMSASSHYTATRFREEAVLAAKQPPSLLQLLHPAGQVTRTRVIGGRCPPCLFPAGADDWKSGVDLLVMAPSETECRDRNWMQNAAQTMADVLASDGLGYVLAPQRWRLHTAKLLRQHGLSIGPTIAHYPDWRRSRYLIPLSPTLASYAFSTILPMITWQRYLLALGLRLPANVLSAMRPANAFVVRHPGARPLSAWLFHLVASGDGDYPSGDVVVSTSWRQSGGAIILHCFNGGDAQPSRTAKVAPAVSSSALATEARLLTRLGPDARRAGSCIPRPLFAGPHGPWAVLLETAVVGRSAAHHLREHPDRLPVILEQLSAWLECWHRLTAVTKPLDIQCLESALLQPLAQLAPAIEGGVEYYHWLKRQCVAVTGAPMPFVASHNDLTMDNVLLQGQGNLGILDWETAVESGFPLVDFYYAVVDAVAATENDATRLGGFKACFTAHGAQSFRMARLEQRLIRALPNLSPALVNLCFHACWLHHALNEQAATYPAERRPFLTILQWMARHYPTQLRPGPNS